MTAYFILAHLLSQLTRKYQKFELPCSFCLYDSKISSWCDEDWFDFIDFCGVFYKDSFPSLKIFLEDKKAKMNLVGEIKDLYERSYRHNFSIIPLCNSFYPAFLKEIPDPPHCLFVRGDKQKLKGQMLSVVGARKASSHVIRTCFDLGSKVADLGINIVSGGAYGCDISTHIGTLKSRMNPASTIVVLPGGLSHNYPRGNKYIFDKIIAEGGCLVSEKLCNTQVKPYDFPVRNRIISGFSMCTIIMEAGLKSGTLLTAKSALEQGREVLVYEPKQKSYLSEGSYQLILDGADVFSSLEELFTLRLNDIFE
ncbi:MAG: DNA-protecting protein DprA [Zetaproteobacteria bacterium]|nr:DNA-protecting protein DprA [Pseudobdellovibrionaceae bacterium]